VTTLESATGQILDKLSDLVVGPVQGTVTAIATRGTPRIMQGQLAQLPDGRRVRARRTKVLCAQPTMIPVRLEHLSPSFPAARNYLPIHAGVRATWLDGPADIEPSAAMSAFGPGVMAAGLHLGSVVENDRVTNGEDLFAAGAEGTAKAVLLAPSLRPIGDEHEARRGWFEATWRLRINLDCLSLQKTPRALARTIFDALAGCLLGATVADDIVRFGPWEPVRHPGPATTWELVFMSRLAVDGRVSRAVHQTDPELTGAVTTITLLGDDAQPAPFRVQDEMRLR
jgi:hypothetical protein